MCNNFLFFCHKKLQSPFEKSKLFTIFVTVLNSLCHGLTLLEKSRYKYHTKLTNITTL